MQLVELVDICEEAARREKVEKQREQDEEERVKDEKEK